MVVSLDEGSMSAIVAVENVFLYRSRFSKMIKFSFLLMIQKGKRQI